MHTFRVWLIALGLVLCATPALAVDDFYGPAGANTQSAARPHSAHHAAGKTMWDESYSQEVDFQAFMGRLYTVLTSPEYLGRFPESVQAADYLKGLGYFSLAGSQCEYTISGDAIDMFTSCSYADLDPESYCGKTLALPNAKPASAGLVGKDDFLAYIVMNNVPQMLMIEANEMNKAQELAQGDSDLAKLLSQAKLGDMGDLGEVLGMLKALKLDETMMQALTGELALVVYGVPAFDKLQGNNLQPGDVDVCLMLGLSDDKFIGGLIEQFGKNAGLMEMEVPGGWTGYNMQGQESMGLVYNKDVVVVSPNIKATLAHMAAAKGRSLNVPECQCYMDFNVTALHDGVLAPLADMAAKQLGEAEPSTCGMSYLEVLPVMSYLVALPAPNELGHLTMMTSYAGDADMMEFHARMSQAKYATYYLGLGLCAAGQAGLLDKAIEELAPGATTPETEEVPEAGAVEEDK